MPQVRGGASSALVCAFVFACHAAADEGAPRVDAATPTVEAVGAAPLPGIGLSLQQIPANVQTATGAQIAAQHRAGLADFLGQNLGSVHIADTQNNPFQLDVNFRGFAASPVVGTPQGLSVFLDGVRVNEAFGDVVNWDLIPQNAVGRVDLIPGSNPVFGLNTLGGALATSTKDGFRDAGASARVDGGSFGRRGLQLENGAHSERYDYFVAGNVYADNGWADHNPSRVNQLFAKTGYQDDTTDVHLTLVGGDTQLAGNQTLPLSMLSHRAQAYTFPDVTENQLTFLNLSGNHAPSADVVVSANAYYRRLRSRIFNSNINDEFDPTQPPGSTNPPALNAINDLDESRPGGAVQLSARRDIAGRPHQIVMGAGYDGGDSEFRQFRQPASIAPDRDMSSDAPLDPVTRLRTRKRSYGVYASDTFALGARWDATLAGRYDRTALTLDDQLGTALDGRHRFQRFNPAAGVTFHPRRDLTAYASFNEGMRVPTAVELSCADPNAPCRLPNAFAADPSLDAIVARTWEAGVRAKWLNDVNVRAAVFRSRVDDDIQFISSGGSGVNAGFFETVGTTRRQGLELSADGKRGRLGFQAQYSLIDATFESPLILNSPNNSSAAPLSCPSCTEIQVRPGDRIPGIPRHLLKLRAEYDVSAAFAAGGTMLAQSSQFARGDENNRDANGPVPGFVIFNVDSRYDVGSGWQMYARIDNVFDRRYETFGVLGRNVFTGANDAFDPSNPRSEQFRSVAAPRAIWLGIAYRVPSR